MTIEPKEIEDSNILPTIENEKRYKLRFSKDIMAKVRVFCESFHIELNKFIVNTVGNFLFDIEDDIGSKRFSLIGGYFNVSKLVEVQSSNNTHEANEKINEIEAEFPLLISKAIDYFCDKIPLTPEEFIVDTINEEIDLSIDNVKEGCYNFLGRYKDFSKITESIDQIYKKNLL